MKLLLLTTIIFSTLSSYSSDKLICHFKLRTKEIKSTVVGTILGKNITSFDESIHNLVIDSVSKETIQNCPLTLVSNSIVLNLDSVREHFAFEDKMQCLYTGSIFGIYDIKSNRSLISHYRYFLLPRDRIIIDTKNTGLNGKDFRSVLSSKILYEIPALECKFDR